MPALPFHNGRLCRARAVDVGSDDDVAPSTSLPPVPGGCVQVVCAADVRSRFGLQPLLYTFGQPRVGDYDFSAAIAETKRAFRCAARAHRPQCAPRPPPLLADLLLTLACLAAWLPIDRTGWCTSVTSCRTWPCAAGPTAAPTPPAPTSTGQR